MDTQTVPADKVAPIALYKRGPPRIAFGQRIDPIAADLGGHDDPYAACWGDT